jgi:hypothetical protein
MTALELTIPPPTSDRCPLKVNLFDYAKNTATTLAPLFPYLDEGSIVPCITVQRGGPGRRYSRFQHLNTVDEVIMMFGTPGGMLFVGPKLHPVSAPFDDPKYPLDATIALITQRQLIGKPQREEYRFLCDNCDRRLSVAAFDATPQSRDATSDTDALFPTLVEGYRAAKAHNADEANLRCTHCGHMNERFPFETWGWDVYAEQGAVAANIRAATSAASNPTATDSEGEAR